MLPANRLELAAAARAHVARVLALLERPTLSALNQSAAELATAIARIEELQSEVVGMQVASLARTPMVALRKDLSRVGRLLRNAWELRLGRSSQMEYSQEGEWVDQPVPAARLSLKA